MKLFFSFVFLFFSSALFQAQAQVLIPGPILEYDFNQFDWQAFSNKENVQKHIDFRNETFSEIGADFVIYDINLDKRDLIRLEQELELYRLGIKKNLPVDTREAEEAIRLHWADVNRIENQMRFWAGLGGSDAGLAVQALIEGGTDYRKEAWELYKGDHEVVFNMVEKKDKALYEALGGSDEAYAGFIAPYVERYTAKMEELGQEYYGFLELAYEGEVEFDAVNVMRLIEMYSDSLKAHNCFKENFKGWTGGAQQRDLEGAIKAWHTQQGLFGVNSFVQTYRHYKEEYGTSFKIGSVAANLFKFTEAPERVREKMIDFYRNDIWNNEEFKASKERTHLKARVNALIGLNFMNALNEKERRVFNRALEEGIISNPGKDPNAFFGFARPLPP